MWLRKTMIKPTLFSNQTHNVLDFQVKQLCAGGWKPPWSTGTTFGVWKMPSTPNLWQKVIMNHEVEWACPYSFPILCLVPNPNQRSKSVWSHLFGQWLPSQGVPGGPRGSHSPILRLCHVSPSRIPLTHILLWKILRVERQLVDRGPTAGRWRPRPGLSLVLGMENKGLYEALQEMGHIWTYIYPITIPLLSHYYQSYSSYPLIYPWLSDYYPRKAQRVAEPRWCSHQLFAHKPIVPEVVQSITVNGDDSSPICLFLHVLVFSLFVYTHIHIYILHECVYVYI